MVIAIIITLVIAIIGFLLFVILKGILAPKAQEGIIRLTKQGKYQQAIKLANQLISKNPKDFISHYYLGKALLAVNNQKEALTEYRNVDDNVVFDGQLKEIPFRKEYASLLMKLGNKDEALKQYILLTTQDSMNAEHFYKAGLLSSETGKKDNALIYLNKCIKINPRHAKAFSVLGNIYFQEKKISDAKASLDKAISLNPNEYSCYYYLGKLLKEEGDIGGAVKAFDKAQRDNEYKQKALIERGNCYILAGRADNAQIDLQRAIDIDKEGLRQETLYARYFLAASYEKEHKIDKALEQWQYIANRNKNFRDVSDKLNEYKDLQTNDNMKDFLTASDAEFVEICKGIALKSYKLASQQTKIVKNGCVLLAVEAGEGDWRTVRKQVQYLRFIRAGEPVEEQEVRDTLDKAKAMNCTKSFIIASSEFTRGALTAAEGRPVELIDKDKLEKMLG